MRVRAFDEESTPQTREWTTDSYVVNIDANVPVISDLKLVQYGLDAGGNSLSSGTVVTERPNFSQTSHRNPVGRSERNTDIRHHPAIFGTVTFCSDQRVYIIQTVERGAGSQRYCQNGSYRSGFSHKKQKRRMKEFLHPPQNSDLCQISIT